MRYILAPLVGAIFLLSGCGGAKTNQPGNEDAYLEDGSSTCSGQFVSDYNEWGELIAALERNEAGPESMHLPTLEYPPLPDVEDSAQ
jgi:hypothetical protein